MIREQRRRRILELVRQNRLVSIHELADRLDVSYMTISRDLEELEVEGSLRRIRGGAMLPAEDLELASPSFPPFHPQNDPHRLHKVTIGRYASTHLVEDGDYITIEAGSTASNMIQFLHQGNLTILTNGLLASIQAAPNVNNLTLICSGGVLIETGAFIGPQTEDFFSKFRVKKVFFGAQGLTLSDGFTDPTPLYTRLKNAMRLNADKAIMLLDSSKFGIRSLVQVMTLEEVDTIVTDAGAPPEIVAGLRSRGIDIRIADE
jgi:DeoR/GlpR family transcriptional regulator of sugar metabolism